MDTRVLDGHHNRNFADAGDFLLATNISLSGNNYTKVALLFRFMRMETVSQSQFENGEPFIIHHDANIDLSGDWGCTFNGEPFVIHQDANIDLSGDWGCTFDGEPFIIHQDANIDLSGDWGLHLRWRAFHHLPGCQH